MLNAKHQMPIAQHPTLLLAMDTSGDICSIALFRAGRLSAEFSFRHEMHLSERLIGQVDALLSTLGGKIGEVDCYAVGVGPGSFTGTRIGVMTMKTFAYFHEAPIFTVNSLEAIAAEYTGLPGYIVTPVLTCRRGTVYACPFSVEGVDPVPLAPPNAYSFADLAALLNGIGPGPVLFCGPAAHSYAEELRNALGERAADASFGSAEYPRASGLGRLALQRYRSGEQPQDPLAVTPLYISPPPITMPKTPIPRGTA
jgi:tRNA threonylcarbamoyladenosine biosynthesis protein TsaB